MNISRRKALSVSGLAAAGVLGVASMQGCATTASEDKHEEINETATATNKWAKLSCVQIGDNITWYDGNKNTTGEVVVGYATYLRKIFKSVDNMAVSGAAIAYHPESTYESVCVTVDKINFKDYDCCTIAAGINDCLYQNSEIGEVIPVSGAKKLKNFNKSTFYGAYQYVLNKIYSDNPSIQIIIVTPLQSKATSEEGYANAIGATLSDYYNATVNISNMYATALLDFYTNSGFNYYTFDTYTIDGLHPNNSGFKMLSQKMVSFINNL